MMINTTLNKIREFNPCKDGWEKLLKNLGKTQADDEPLTFNTILESNGLDDAIWCLRTLDKEQFPKIVLMSADFAERVLHIYEIKYPGDYRPRLAIKAARDYVNGLIYARATAARAAAARAAACAARAAARATAADAAACAARAAAADAAVYTAVEREAQAELFLKYFGEEK